MSEDWDVFIPHASEDQEDFVRPLALALTLTATGRSTAHTKCRNEVKDLKRSVKLRGRAVAENKSERGTVES